MKIAHIVNNFGKTYDGIGSYAKAMYNNLPKDVEDIIYSSECRESSNKFKYIFNFGMTREIFRCVKNFSADKADVVLIEYPFKEWNPFILIPIYCLSIKCRKNKIPLIISLHEYGRTHHLRKLMCRLICTVADHVLVTTDEMKNDVSGFSNKISLRSLPSCIWNKKIIDQDIKKEHNSFAFFGLVNSAKAFSEMMSAWDIFNKERKYHLYIISGSKLEDIEKQHIGVSYIYNASDITVLKILRRCAYCFIPIKPEVDFKNSSFKTATVAGCICIGKFCEKISELPFVVQMDGYTVENFTVALKKLAVFSNAVIDDKTTLSAEYGKQFYPSETFKKTSKTISEIACRKGKYNGNL